PGAHLVVAGGAQGGDGAVGGEAHGGVDVRAAAVLQHVEGDGDGAVGGGGGDRGARLAALGDVEPLDRRRRRERGGGGGGGGQDDGDGEDGDAHGYLVTEWSRR